MTPQVFALILAAIALFLAGGTVLLLGLCKSAARGNGWREDDEQMRAVKQ